MTYIRESLLHGLKILGFDKETVRLVSKEKSLEEIFLSTLFMNYLLVLFVYLIGIIVGGYSISGKELNMPVFFGLLMVYPFTYNLIVYVIYGFFGFTAEMLDKKKTVKPLISVGFHTAIVYSILVMIIGLLSFASVSLGLFLFAFFAAYFIYTMFLSISTVYNFSLSQVLIVLFIPFLVIGIAIMMLGFVVPEIPRVVVSFLFM